MKLRITLDSKHHVVKEIIVKNNLNLEELHFIIIKLLNFENIVNL